MAECAPRLALFSLRAQSRWEAIGGLVTAESVVGAGRRFRVLLPVAPA